MCFSGVSCFEIVGIVTYRDLLPACFPPCLKYQLLAAKSCTVNATSNIQKVFLLLLCCPKGINALKKKGAQGPGGWSREFSVSHLAHLTDSPLRPI